jgi:ubiquinone/menaquinone biosynthesis C-methylase UbiE
MATGIPPIEQVKQMMKATWAAGDFGKIAELTTPAGEQFVARLGLKPGMRVLDVGCGTGNQSIPAARTGAQVTAVDIAPNLLAQARERASREGLDIAFQEGDAEALPFRDGEFDVVLSMFAAIFAPRPEMVVSEFLRVCKPGGLIAMGNWTADSFIAQQSRITAKFFPPPAGIPNPMEWGDETVATQRFGDRAEVKTARRPFVFAMPFGPEQAHEHFRKYTGRTQMAYERLDEAGKAQLSAEMKDHWMRENRGGDQRTFIET